MPLPPALADKARSLGFYRTGVARAVPVNAADSERFDAWLAESRHAGMDYMERYGDVRRDPQLLLPGARSVVMAAMSYYHEVPDTAPAIAMYAHGEDYHEVMRERLAALADAITKEYGGETRVCVDTAPLRERYWAVQAGLGFIGLNGQLIIPGAGSYFFLGAVLTTAEIAADAPCVGSCDACRRCISACPGHALRGDGSVDARRCLSYLTIEYRGDFPPGTDLCGRLYGCDACQTVCPHNATPPADREPRFALRPSYLQLTPEVILDMTPEAFAETFRHSAIKRAKLAGLRRNALNIINQLSQTINHLSQ